MSVTCSETHAAARLTKARRPTSAAVAAVALAALCSGCAMGIRHNTMIGGVPHAYVQAGDGSPTVVFEAGIGNDLSTWSDVFSGVAEGTNVFAYSRAGYTGGGFAGGPSSRDADWVARRLKQLLDENDVAAPYVLVGHSAGGNYVLRFAHLYPEEVVGVVLVDGRPGGFRKACERADIYPCSPPSALSLVSPAHIAAEIRGLEDAEQQTPSAESLGSLPVTVIAGTEPPLGGSDEAQVIWLTLQERFATDLEDGRYVVAQGAGHFVHKDQPDLVVSEILSMVERVRP